MPPLNPKLAVALAVFVVVLAGIGYGIYAKTEENSAIEAEITRLRDEIKGFDDIIETRAQKEKDRDAQKEVFRGVVSILPQYTERQEDVVLNELTKYATIAKLKPGGFVITLPDLPKSGAPAGPPRPPAPGQQAAKDFARTGLTMRWAGTFANFVHFLSLVENHESFLQVDSFTLTPLPVAAEAPQPESRELSITVRVSTFHHVTK